MIGRPDQYFPEVSARICNGGAFLSIHPGDLEGVPLDFPVWWSDRVNRGSDVYPITGIELYPEILDGTDKFPSERSCAEASVSAPQAITANITAARAVVDMVYNILVRGEIDVQVDQLAEENEKTASLWDSLRQRIPCTYQKRIKAVCKRCELQGVSVHALRHTFATRLMEQNVPIRIIQQLLGHSSITTTEKYSHALDEEKAKAVNRISDFLPSIGKIAQDSRSKQ